jgi:cytochrome c-L
MKFIKLVAVAALPASVMFGAAALAQQDFRHTITGEILDLSYSPAEGKDTPAVKKFLAEGVNPYNEVKACLPEGEQVYLTACSGCHGHLAEGKLGPGLNDSYWTYPKNKTDKGLFETTYGGAQGMMGPQGSNMQLDEMLKLMAWIRHLFTGPAEEAEWLTEEQRAGFQPFKAPPKGDDARAQAMAQEASKEAAEDAQTAGAAKCEIPAG